MDINFKNGSKIVAGPVTNTTKVFGVSVINSLSHIPTQIDLDNMMGFFGIEGKKIVKCPECNMKCQIVHMIPHLNDRGDTYSASYSTALGKGTIKGFLKQEQIKRFTNHEWSFKQIGKWLESLGY